MWYLRMSFCFLDGSMWRPVKFLHHDLALCAVVACDLGRAVLNLFVVEEHWQTPASPTAKLRESVFLHSNSSIVRCMNGARMLHFHELILRRPSETCTDECGNELSIEAYFVVCSIFLEGLVDFTLCSKHRCHALSTTSCNN